MSGTESQMMMWFVAFGEGEEGWTAIHISEERARDLDVSDVDELEGVDGREVKEEFPA